MVIDPAALATITGAVSVISDEYFKGIATEAGKATWSAIKHLLGWTSDPHPDEVPQRVADALTVSPVLVDELLYILKSDAYSTTLVGKIEASGGKVVVAQTIMSTTFQM